MKVIATIFDSRVAVAFIACVASFLLSSSPVFAKDTSERNDSVSAAYASEERPEVVIGNDKIFLGDLWADFLTVAFSEDVWNQDTFLDARPEKFPRMLEWYGKENSGSKLEIEAKRKRMEEVWPWYADFVYHSHGWPDHNVIHKWESDLVTIGVGWPTRAHTDFYGLISDELGKAVPAVEKASGLKIKLIPPTEETPNNFGKIRIVPVKALNVRSWGKSNKNVLDEEDYERWLWGGVLFETSDLLHMEGYLLPNADNTLGLAVCKIMVAGVPEQVFRALVRECLVRSMGLPDISNVERKSLLSDWRKSILTSKKRPGAGEGEIGFGDAPPLVELPKSGVFANAKSRPAALKYLPDSISEYDLFLLSLLYCPAIESGMGKNDIVRIFSKDQCISKTKQTIKTGESRDNL